MLCDEPNYPQTRWCMAAILMLMGMQGSCGLVGLKWDQVRGSTVIWGLAGSRSRLGVVFSFFFLEAQAKEAVPTRACLSDSYARSEGSWAKLEEYQRSLFVRCLLMSHWPRHVIWPNPKPMGQGSKIHPQRKEKGSEYLPNKPNSQRIQELHFLTQAITTRCWIGTLRALLNGRGIEGLGLAIQSVWWEEQLFGRGWEFLKIFKPA